MHVNRKDARAAGDRLYLTGKVCLNGHDAPRYVSTGHCSACLAAARGADQEQHRQAMAARFTGARQFSYPLHPDDHAAAHAFCQALDLQRGRVPQASANVVAPPSDSYARNAVAERRAELLQQHAPAAQEARQLPAEMAAALRAQGLLP